MDQEAYTIGNYDSIERGEISLYTAMAESDNTVFVQLASDLGYGQRRGDGRRPRCQGAAGD